MNEYVRRYIAYLAETKKAPVNTVVSYQRDLKKMTEYFESQGITDVTRVNKTNINSYILYLERTCGSTATQSRYIASMKAFFMYLRNENDIDTLPTMEIKAPHVEKKAPDILSVEEMMCLLQQPDCNTAKGKRDKAMLELLYATGIRVTELITLCLSDVNMEMSYIQCRSRGKARIVPFHQGTKKALSEYLLDARMTFVKENDTDILFTNYVGEPMSRQGFWKLMKAYAVQAGIDKGITPHTLRHSFAAHLVENGADLRAVQEMMGHSDLSSTQIYATMANNKIRDVYVRSHPLGNI